MMRVVHQGCNNLTKAPPIITNSHVQDIALQGKLLKLIPNCFTYTLPPIWARVISASTGVEGP